MSDHIPFDVLVGIVKATGQNSFRDLLPYIQAGKEGRNAAYTEEVLKVANLQEAFENPKMVNKGSNFREFLKKCFIAANPMALYLEGLRKAVKNGPYQHGVCCMTFAADEILHAQFASGIFTICEGEFVAGMEILRKFYRRTSHVQAAVAIADVVMNQIIALGPSFPGKYNRYFRYDDLPSCIFGGFRMNTPYYECMAYWYTFAVISVC